ncbi:MAG TPA: O-succinylhomoserine sulfhydrylase [Hyphomicrobiaceae bacterium]|jgi:O-succinylhomoserine sulfhydrylase|nr:O-succinylhomoserine sulfhydrylase [Hyphomicrobiaceae bacterium]
MTDKPQPAQTTEAWSPETQLVHGGCLRSGFAETSEALFLTQSYVYASAEQAEERFKNEAGGFIYSRYANPTVAMFEERMRLLEGAEAARATATGMAAVTSALLCFLKAGDHIVAGRALFGSCRYVVEDLCPRFGIACSLVDGRDTGAWQKAVRPNTKAFFFETPANPTLDLIDIASVAEIAHAAGATVVVDNVFATPMLQKPLKLGADVVVYSATKHIDGQGRCLGGIVLGSASYVKDHLHNFLKHTGPSLSPFNAWVMLKGLETLPLRVRAQCESATRIADHLAGRRGVKRVLFCGRSDHPQAALAARQMTGPGQVVVFDIDGDKQAAFRFLNALKLIKISNNLGDAKSLVTHPATTTHQRLSPEVRAELGIPDSMLRLSVGLETWTDLAADVDAALAASNIG